MLLRNAIRTPDGTVIESLYTHDFVCHLDANGQRYCVDGGNSYARRVGGMDYEDLSVEDTGEIALAREHLTWGTYGKPEDWIIVGPKFRRVKFKDMSNAHIEAILEDNAAGRLPLDGQYLRYFKKELDYRVANKIHIED